MTSGIRSTSSSMTSILDVSLSIIISIFVLFFFQVSSIVIILFMEWVLVLFYEYHMEMSQMTSNDTQSQLDIYLDEV